MCKSCFLTIDFYSGYMSPEYAMEGLFSIKSDVYSFGVLVLEIVSGRRNTSFYDSERPLNLIGHVCIRTIRFTISFFSKYYSMRLI